MTAIGWDFVPADGQELPLSKNIGTAVAELLKRCWPYHTTKQVARAFGYERVTATNVVKGHVSERSLTTMIHAQQRQRGDAWELWDAIGAEVIGESREAYEERKLRLIIEEAERAQQGVQRLRTRREHLERIAAALGDLQSGSAAQHRWNERSRSWQPDDGLGGSAAGDQASSAPKGLSPVAPDAAGEEVADPQNKTLRNQR